MENDEIKYPEEPELLDELYLEDEDTVKSEDDADEIEEDDGEEFVEQLDFASLALFIAFFFHYRKCWGHDR